MKVFVILEGVIDNTYRICNPAIREFHVCETGFRTLGDAEQSLIDSGWRNDMETHVQWALGAGAWVHEPDPDDVDEDDQPKERVRYVFETEDAG